MFNRIVYEDSATWFTIVAFVVAAAIFVTISWRALRMRRSQVEHFENLPFVTATPACLRGDSDRNATGPRPHSAIEGVPMHRP